MQSWNEIKHYAGFDWAGNHHQVVVVDPQGQIVANFQFDHSEAGWKVFGEKVAAFSHLAVAIETSQGAAVDQLLQRGYTVYPVNPAAASGYRQRKAPSGTKSDELDGWALGDALRVDGHAWKPLSPLDDRTCQLRLLCRDEVALIEQRTFLVNQLQQALVEYYPAALEAFDDWTCPFTWHFIVQFPTPELLVKAGKRRWEKFLHTQRLWRPETAETRLAIFARADHFKGSAAVTQAKSQLAVSLCRCLRTLQEQLDLYRQRIEELFASHPDHHLFGGLPGAGKTLAPRLLAGVGSDPNRYTNCQGLQCLAGTAPIRYQSGQINKVHVRHQCDKFLRHTVHLWANAFRKGSAWGQAYYQKKRQDGMSHACALRCLGQRLLKIIFRIITDKKPYDAELHARNQHKHGSWVLTLVNQPAA